MVHKYVFCFIKIVRMSIDFISGMLFNLIYRNYEHQSLPPITNLLLMDSASTLARKIRERKITSEEVVRSFIARIQEVNPILNCMVDNRFDLALEEAKAVDAKLQSSDEDKEAIARETPFLGVPFTTKDAIQVKGLHLTAGHVDRRDIISSSDATSIMLMKKAGAIIMGVTNVSELCMWWESSNNLFGRTNNPYDTRRIVGGSSGGEGCVLSSCGSPIGIGSDIGGSIRMPAYFNGIFGHKPSTGIVSNEGMEPIALGKLDKMLSVGPMSRHACDLRPALRVLADSNTALLKIDTKVPIKDLKFYYIEDDGGSAFTSPVCNELRSAMRSVVSHLKLAHKVHAKRLVLKDLRNVVPAYVSELGSEKSAPTFSQELALKKGSINVWTELLKCLIGQSKHTFPGLSLCLLEKLKMEEDPRKEFLAATVTAISAEIKDILGDDGVLLYPSHPTLAPFHKQPVYRPFNWAYTALFNMLGVPVTQCPLGLSKDRRPLGVQVVSNINNDHICLSVAEELEKAFGGWVCPSVVE